MTELLDELVRQADAHSTITLGDFLIEDVANIEAWILAATDEQKIIVVTDYLRETI